MSPQKQDYLLRLIEELGQFLAEVTKLRSQGNYGAAMLTILQAQERLFARPAKEFISRPVEDQVALLVIGETAADSREKCLAYARLLTEAGIIYQAKDQTALALGAYRFALHVLLLARERIPGFDPIPLADRLGPLLDQLPEDGLKDEVRGLLRQLAAPSPTQRHP
jgi:hypothetical protein